MSALVPLREAAGSLAKASTPQPFSTSRTSNWVARVGGLPDYIQHIAHGIMRSQKVKDESKAIQEAIGVCKNPPASWDAEAHAACAKAIAEWEKKKAQNAAKGAVKESWSAPTLSTLVALREDALQRVAVLEARFGQEGLVALLQIEPLLEAASPRVAMTLKRVASASGELERHEVEHEGQTVGTISRRGGAMARDGDRWHARAVNGEAIAGQYDNPLRSKDAALQAIQAHLSEAPARVVSLPTAGKYLVARPSTYGQTTYTEYASEPAARHAAGLPPNPTLPERESQVAKLGEMLRFDLLTLSGDDIPPLRRVQEARRSVPLAV